MSCLTDMGENCFPQSRISVTREADPFLTSVLNIPHEKEKENKEKSDVNILDQAPVPTEL